jgi:hypothetical protein
MPGEIIKRSGGFAALRELNSGTVSGVPKRRIANANNKMLHLFAPGLVLSKGVGFH